MNEIRESVRAHGATGFAQAQDFDRKATQAPPLTR
jgi:hypothetical protein